MYSFKADQLYWLEELDKNYFVEVRAYQAFLNGYIKEWNNPEIRKIISLRDLEKFKSENRKLNLFRSWCVYKDKDCKDMLGPVPFVLDIDGAYKSFEWQKAYQATKNVLGSFHIEKELRQGRVRVIFSGSKGFHVEIKPTRLLDALDLRKKIILEVRGRCRIKESDRNSIAPGIVVDKPHDYFRLTGSWNCWIDEVGKTVRRKVLQMTPTEFEKDGVLEIIKKSEDNVDALI